MIFQFSDYYEIEELDDEFKKDLMKLLLHNLDDSIDVFKDYSRLKNDIIQVPTIKSLIHLSRKL